MGPSHRSYNAVEAAPDQQDWWVVTSEGFSATITGLRDRRSDRIMSHTPALERTPKKHCLLAVTVNTNSNSTTLWQPQLQV
jgi:hypothetical protein